MLVMKRTKNNQRLCFLLILLFFLNCSSTVENGKRFGDLTAQLRLIRSSWVEFLKTISSDELCLSYNRSYVSFWTDDEFINLDIVVTRCEWINEVIRSSHFKRQRLDMFKNQHVCLQMASAIHTNMLIGLHISSAAKMNRTVYTVNSKRHNNEFNWVLIGR